MAKRRKRTPAQAQARRRELDRIRKQARRMKAKGFEVDLGDLSKKTLSELKKINTEKLERRAKLTYSKWADVMTYKDYMSMSKKEREEFMDTGMPPKDLQRKLEKRIRYREKKQEEPDLGAALLEKLEEAINEGLQNGLANLSEEAGRILTQYITIHGRKAAGKRLVVLDTEEFQYVPLCDYVIYIPRGEQVAASQTLAIFVRVLEDREPTRDELDVWDETVDVFGWDIDPVTGEPIT